MTTEELLNRVESRLNRTGNPSLPPDETMQAILELGKEREEAIKERIAAVERETSLANRIEYLSSEKEELEHKVLKAEDKAKEQEWVAFELAKFVKAVANGIYAGQERAAANRVYDLNANSITKRRLNCYSFDSLPEAKKKYAAIHPDKPEDVDAFLEWLFAFCE